VINPSPGSPRVVLHIGAPKSGTTYLQRLLWQNRAELAAAGIGLPGENQREMFEAAIEVREVADRWGRDEESLRGTWARLCAQARDFPGTMVMSHELLAAATPEQVARALSHLDGLEVHVVYTAREISRQLVSEWQENVKNGSVQSFEKFRRRVMAAQGPADHLFWRYQNVLEVLARWASELPPDRVHVVVAPVGGAEPVELWRRFAVACGADPDVIADPVVTQGANQTLGMTQVRLLRRVVESLDGRIEQPDYARVVKRMFAQRVLAGQSSPRPSCPPELFGPLTDLSQTWIQGIGERGYRVHGDLRELVPPAPAEGVRGPDEVDEGEELAVAAAAIADLLIEVAEQTSTARGKERRRPGTDRPGSGHGPRGGPAGNNGASPPGGGTTSAPPVRRLAGRVHARLHRLRRKA
jgi:hypothetical protein